MATVIDAADIKDYADEYCRMHKDAARYRWLRENTSFETEAFLSNLTPEQYDMVVDSYMTNTFNADVFAKQWR